MLIEFATCERSRALGFLQRVYPKATITDSKESAGPLLDLVEADVVRIQDPTMYGNQIAVRPGKNWDEGRRAECFLVANAFHMKAMKESA